VLPGVFVSLLVSDIFAPVTVLLGHLPTAGRLALTRLLESQAGVRVASAGENATDLLTIARRLRPALLIVSEMQLRVVERLSRHMVLPVLLYCEEPPLVGMLRETKGWGVAGFIPATPHTTHWAQEVLRKVRQLLPRPSAPLQKIVRLATVPGLPGGVIVIGGSTGGTAAVEQLVRALPATLACAVLIAVHLPASFLDSFVNRLARVSALPVVAGWAGTRVEPGRIIVAPGGRNLLIRPGLNSPWQSWQTDFSSEFSPSGDEPSIDILMRSVARTVGRNVVGVVLTGMGRDGTLGAQVIRQHGGTVLVQDEVSSAVFSMPKSVIQAGHANEVLPLRHLADAIVRYAEQFGRVASRRTGAAPSVSRSV